MLEAHHDGVHPETTRVRGSVWVLSRARRVCSQLQSARDTQDDRVLRVRSGYVSSGHSG